MSPCLVKDEHTKEICLDMLTCITFYAFLKVIRMMLAFVVAIIPISQIPISQFTLLAYWVARSNLKPAVSKINRFLRGVTVHVNRRPVEKIIATY